MRATVPTLAVALLLVLAGCTTGPGAGGTASPTATPTEQPTSPTTVSPTDQSPSPTDQSPSTTDTRTPSGTPVEYVVRPGEIPDEVASYVVTIQIVFVETPEDLGPCYSEIYYGPYKPTITPLGPPEGECHRTETVEVDLTEIDGERSLGEFTAPASARGHAVIVTDVTATLDDGTTLSKVKGIGGHEALRDANRPSGTYGVEIGLLNESYTGGAEWIVVSERFQPSE
jgi:hypothetical protein